MSVEQGKFTLRLQHGEAHDDVWVLDQSSDNKSWTRLTTDGYSIAHQIRKTQHEDSELLLDVSAHEYVSINDAGQITWHIPAAVVLTIPVGVWYHDIALVDASNDAQYLVQGPVVVEGRTTVI